jgi:hypothetical protein
MRGDAAYLVADAPLLLVEMHRVGPGMWTLVQIAGPKNEAPPDGTEAALRKGLTDAGLKIVAVDPASALSRLAFEARRGRVDGADDLDDDTDDLGEVAA